MTHTKKLANHDLANKKNLAHLIHDGRFKVAIFGSARIESDHPVYSEVRDFARSLAYEGYDIITGGGPGAMEAASLGHHEACTGNESQTIGINIELPYEQKPNKYLDITESTSTFSARLDTFMLLSHIFVVAPGGIGTLLELFYTWQLMQVGHICRSPIILWGSEYKEILHYVNHTLVEKGFVKKDEADLAIQVNTAEHAFALIKEAQLAHESLGENACVNIHQYMAGARRLGLI